MRKIMTVALAGALAASAFAPLAYAQSGQDTGTNRGGATTNSGMARPDASGAAAPSGETGAASRAAPTQGSTSGSGTSRPDAAGASATGAPEASQPKKATGTQNQ